MTVLWASGEINKAKMKCIGMGNYLVGAGNGHGMD